MAGLALLVLWRPVVLLDEGSGASGWWTFALFVSFASAAISCFMLPRILRAPPVDVIAVSWAFAVIPALPAASANLVGLVETWTYNIGALISASLLVASVLRAGRV